MPDWITLALTDSVWVGGATWGAGVLTLVGLALTYRQASRALGAAQAAREATVRTKRKLDQYDHIAGLGEAGQVTTRIKEYATMGNPQATRLALEMLRTKIDGLEATAEGNGTVIREHRELEHILGILERHVDEAANSKVTKLDANTIANHMNDVRRMLSKRIERVKRWLPENDNV